MTVDDVPDTGSLRSDLLAVRFGRKRSDDSELMSGLISAVKENPDVAAAFQQQFVALPREPHARPPRAGAGPR